MVWQFTSDVLISLLSAFTALTIGLISLRWWNKPGVVYYILLMISSGGLALFSGLEAASIQIPEKVIWAKIQYIFISLIIAFWFLFVLQYTHQEKQISPWWVFSLFVIPFLTVYIILTETQHHWLWESITATSTSPGAPLIYTQAWWSAIFSAYNFFLVIIGSLVLILTTISKDKSNAIRALVLLTGILPPLICNLLFQTQLFTLISLGILLLASLVVTGMIYFWGIFYFTYLESSSLSHDVIIDKMSEGIIVLDRKDRIHDINSTALKMLQLTERSARRKSLSDLIAQIPAVEESCSKPGEIITEVKLWNDFPSILSIQTTGLQDKSGQPVGRMLVWRDITNYSQVESTLKDSEAKFKALFQGAPDAIIITDKNNQILLVNNQAITLFGYTRDELVGKSVKQVIPERYHEAYFKYLKAFTDEIETRPGISLPLNGVRKNQREIPIEIALSPVQIPSGILITNIIRDLTIRKRAEEQLTLQGIALEAAANGIIITDRNGNIQWVNPAFCRMTGYSADEVLGKNPRILNSGSVPKEVFDGLWKTILSGNVWHGELINSRKDGQIITEEQTIAPVRDGTGEIVHFIAIKQDISERKRAEGALSKRTEQIATLNRVMQTLTSTLDITKVLNTILSEIQKVVPYDSASVWLSKGDLMEIIAVHGFPDPETLVGTALPLSAGDSPNSQVMRSRAPIIVEDAYSTYSSFRTGVHAKYKHRGWMGVPMIISDRVIGMLAFDKKIPNFYTQEQAQFALAFAAQAAIAIENARLYSNAQRELKEKILAEEKLIKLQRNLEEQAIRDSLTGLYNRRFLDETLARELSRAERDKYSVSVVMLDLDRFKVFNDTYGHDVGDMMLKQLGKMLTSQVRAGDIACRYGGEEFVVVMPKASLSAARQRANDWRMKFENDLLIHNGEVLNATLSAGVAVYPLHGTTAEEIIRKADQAMYAAKSAGRNLVITAE